MYQMYVKPFLFIWTKQKETASKCGEKGSEDKRWLQVQFAASVAGGRRGGRGCERAGRARAALGEDLAFRRPPTGTEYDY